MYKKRERSPKRLILRITVVFLTVLMLSVGALYGVMWILVNGPSPTAKRLFVLSVKETSAGGFLADIFLDEEEISEILGSDSSEISDDSTDASLIKLPSSDEDSSVSSDTSNTGNSDVADTAKSSEDIEIIDITSSTYNGKLMVISDPSRVFVGVPDAYGADKAGLTVAAMIEKYDAVAGTNAGGFYDPDGQGTGGIPDGIVIYEGELLWGNTDKTYSLAGIDGNGILHVGNMTGAAALEKGVRYAASYGPALVINGEPAGAQLGGGLNPRTAIGQRADGAILLLVINGRSIDSLGATLDDLAEIMLAHGAVNASNLDGGSSSIMIMDGEYLTSSAYVFGERVVATSILVKK